MLLHVSKNEFQMQMESVQRITHSGMIFRIQSQLHARLCCKIRKLTIPVPGLKKQQMKVKRFCFPECLPKHLDKKRVAGKLQSQEQETFEVNET